MPTEPDPDDVRRASLEQWDASAAGWGRQQPLLREQTAHVSAWMIEAAHLQPGHQVLDLAAGAGETGFLAAELILPGGTLICSDQSEEMLAVARRRARELALENVDFRVLGGEWIDLPLASIDAVLCRWGFMLMADPGAALRETRRVLRSGGRVALSVWDSADANPWAGLPAAALAAHGLTGTPPSAGPGPFALGDEALLRGVLEEGGFTEIEIAVLDVERCAPDFDSWWATHLDLSATTRAAFARADEETTEAVERDLAARLVAYADADGRLAVPGRTLVAAASA